MYTSMEGGKLSISVWDTADMIELGLVLDLLRLLMPSRPFSRILSDSLVICITVYYYNNN